MKELPAGGGFIHVERGLFLMREAKLDYYLNIAAEVAKRGTCLRRNYGAVIVKNDEIVATGYTGAPRGSVNCCDAGECIRQKMGVPSGERYELCRSVHAEMNAIISASRTSMLGATLYLAGWEMVDGKFDHLVMKAEPCRMCRKIITNAGIKDVVSYLDNTATDTDARYFIDSPTLWVIGDKL